MGAQRLNGMVIKNNTALFGRYLFFDKYVAFNIIKSVFTNRYRAYYLNWFGDPEYTLFIWIPKKNINLPSYFLQIKKGAPQSNGERTQKSTSSYCCETNLQKTNYLHNTKLQKRHIFYCLNLTFLTNFYTVKHVVEIMILHLL